MKTSSIAASVIALATASPANVAAFTPAFTPMRSSTTRLYLSSPGPNDALLKWSAEQMKNITPEDINKMMTEMESMGPAQKAALKAVGMEPDLMMRSMKMMKDNPQMAESARKMMENMSPEELMEQSKRAQQQMKSMDIKDVEAATKAMETLTPEQMDAAAEVMEKGLPPTQMRADEPLVVDTMFRSAEMMSQPPTGGVTFQGFATLPPVTALSGTREEDLSAEELEECWGAGSQGLARVDKAGFERVWNEVQEYFDGDIMDESRKTAAKRMLQTSAAPVAAEVVGGTASAAQPTVGDSLSAEQMTAVNARVKNMSEDDVGQMLQQMKDLTPEQEARMKAMGADPKMMAKAAEMMGSNPMMRKAATELMKNMSPEQMMKASQQAQEKMMGMSEEEKKKAIENIEKMNKENN